ncbi:MAG: hypothetical protein KAR39_07080 [Thermoplasmata archaeon]|nr:hypothetical protein [Thermoplasmata archaeon]
MVMLSESDLTVEVFHALRTHFFNDAGDPIEYNLRDKRTTQDDPFDELIYEVISGNLKNAICEKSSALVSPDIVILRPDLCEERDRDQLRDSLSNILAIEVKKLERTKGGSVARASGLDYNTTPPCGTVTVYDRNDKPLHIRSFYLFVCQESSELGKYKLTALTLCDGNAVNEDFELYKSVVGQRKKKIGIGTYGNGADRNRPMLIFPNPLGASELDRAVTLVHPDRNVMKTDRELCLVYRLVRSYEGKRAVFYCYRMREDVEKNHQVVDLENPFPSPTRDVRTQARGRFRLQSLNLEA